MITQTDLEKEIQYLHLISLGNILSLKISFSWNNIYRELNDYNSQWKKYNNRKVQIPRYGLSLTSLDGGLSGIPDLDSVREYNLQNGTNLDETSFKTPTPVLTNCLAIREPINDFLPYLGRSHIIRLDEGGYFPFHRDSNFLGAPTFRLIALFENCDKDNLCFLYNDQRIFLNQNQLYFMNTRINHAVFSFVNNAYLLVLNVIICKESIELVQKSLVAK